MQQTGPGRYCHNCGNNVGHLEKSEPDEGPADLGIIAKHQQVPHDERDRRQKVDTLLSQDQRKGIAYGDQVGDDHRHIDGDHGDRHPPACSPAVVSANEFNQAAIALMADSCGDAQHRPQHGDGEHDHPSDGVAEGCAGDGGGQDRSWIKVGCARDDSGRELAHAAKQGRRLSPVFDQVRLWFFAEQAKRVQNRPRILKSCSCFERQHPL